MPAKKKKKKSAAKKKKTAPKKAVKKKTAARPAKKAKKSTAEGLPATTKMKPLPPGNYMAKVHNVEQRTSKTGREMVVWDLLILGWINDQEMATSRHRGRHQFSWDVAEPRKATYLKKKLDTLEVKFSSWADLEETLQNAVGRYLQIGVRGNFPRQATFFNKRVTAAEAGDAPEE